MTCYANQEWQSWHDERLADIQQAKRIADDHIDGVRFRGEKLPEPLRTEMLAAHIAIANLRDYVEKRLDALESRIANS